MAWPILLTHMLPREVETPKDFGVGVFEEGNESAVEGCSASNFLDLMTSSHARAGVNFETAGLMSR